MTEQQHHDGDGLEDLESDDADAIVTNQPAEGAGSGTDGDPAIGGAGRSEHSPGGKRDTGAAGDDLPQNDMGSVGRNPSGMADGPAQEGAIASGTYNDQGRVVGPERATGDATGDGQGDDLADRLGGLQGRGTGMTGDAASGDMRAGTSSADAAGSDAPSAGDVGGMGGVRGHTAGSGRPPGGSSPGKQD